MKHSKIIARLLELTWKIKPSIYTSMIMGAIITTLNQIFTIMIPKLFIDKYQSGVNFQEFVFYMLQICGIKLIFALLVKGLSIYQNREKEIINQLFLLEFSKKVSRIPYSNLENANVLDLKERAHFTIANYGALYSLFGQSTTLISGIITLATITGILIRFNVIFLMVIIILSAISIYLSSRMVSTLNHMMQEIIPINRRYGYYVGKSLEQENQKDFRLYQMSDLLTSTIGDLNDKTVSWLHKSNIMQANISSIQSIISYVSKFITMVYTALRTISSRYGKQIGLGDFTYYIGITEEFTSVLKTTIESIFHLLRTLHMLEPMVAFMELPESKIDTKIESKMNRRSESDSVSSGVYDTKESIGYILDFQSLEFKNVVFSYPSSSQIILNDISFQIRKGEKISIVGLNNAGKSTVVKLICRLFDPISGEILLNGINIRDLDYEQYMDSIGVIFQDFKLFPFSIRENIDTNGSIADDSIIWAVLERLGIKTAIEQLKDGLDSKLNKNIHKDGIDMSGGQLQKIAIARSIIKKSNMIILDEPTAALDPIAESELYEDFNQLVENKTSIFISHRMSSSTFCDKILLLQDGKIQAFDSHSNLMKGNNLYRDLFEAQSKNYQN